MENAIFSESQLAAKQQAIAELYRGETFLPAAEHWASELGRHFRELSRREGNVLNWHDAPANIEFAEAKLDGEAASTNIDDLSLIHI